MRFEFRPGYRKRDSEELGFDLSADVYLSRTRQRLAGSSGRRFLSNESFSPCLEVVRSNLYAS